MCGLYGFLHYSDNKIKDLCDITNALAEESAVRGTDATGIAYCTNNKVSILKESKSAYKLTFKHADDIKALIGHTRHSTQGSEKKNYNNHPFYGKCKNTNFALAHNGVLSNDKALRKTHRLPKSKVETDSYIAVQLLESKRKLDYDSIKFMAEAVEGSFSFSILDDKNNLWLVKGDSPLSIVHFPNLKLYVYASTEEILWRALIETDLFSELKKSNFEEISIKSGDVLKIRSDGALEKGCFDYTYSYGMGWWDYGLSTKSGDDEYVTDLKSVANYMGYSGDTIDDLLENGFSLEEIEEYLYCMDGEV